MTARFVLLCGALLLWANAALGGGTYQSTKDGKTTVWNDQPKTGDAASWAGGRDHDGYANGFGTLTWYSGQQKKSTVYARYFGNMVRGKFEGAVNAHSKGKTAHAIFTGGTRTSRWATGPAPSRNVTAQRIEPGREEAAAPEPEKPERPTPPPQRAKADAPAVKPSPTPPAVAEKREEPVRPPPQPEMMPSAPEPPPVTKKPSDRPVPKPPSPRNPKPEMDDSLRSLVGPPSSLRPNSVADAPVASPAPDSGSPPVTNPPLTKEEVIDLADTVARAHGYDLGSYQQPATEYHESDDTWSLSYDQKTADSGSETGKHFRITVDNKTKKAAIVAGE